MQTIKLYLTSADRAARFIAALAAEGVRFEAVQEGEYLVVYIQGT